MTHEVDVNVPPARAKPRRFRRTRVFFYLLVTILVGLGLWKAYELILRLLLAYQHHKTTVHVAVAATVVLLIVGLLGWTMRAIQTHRRDRRAIGMGAQAVSSVEEPQDPHAL